MNPDLSPSTRAAAPDIAARFWEIVTGLAKLVHRSLARNPARIPIILLVYKRIWHATRRFSTLANALAAGQPTHVQRTRPKRENKPRPKTPHIPQGKGWLLKDLKHEAAYFRLRLEAFLDDPAVAEIFANTPRAARILRPLCHMLALDPPCLPPPKPRVRKPAKPKPKAKRKPRPRSPVMPPYPTTSRTPWRIIKSRTFKIT